MQLAAGGALGPWIFARSPLRLQESLDQRAAAVVIVHYCGANLVDAGLLGPLVDAVEIGRLLAIELQYRSHILDRLLLGGHMREQIGRADMQARRACNVNVIAGLDADDADVLDSRLGAIARTAGDRKLHLRRRPRTAQEALELDAEPGRILRAKPAPFTANTGLHGAQA